jgi:hypothetical protein
MAGKDNKIVSILDRTEGRRVGAMMMGIRIRGRREEEKEGVKWDCHSPLTSSVMTCNSPTFLI